ncbi:hypothetical protein BGX29_005373 [Mortierella sp. GBA35]|nr:hypothetical protein BGX23_010583 [Mortierella sp. AD031]KAF9107670.1 hypothetical protein BGX29_005373 [Mortierella sp. GBA35]
MAKKRTNTRKTRQTASSEAHHPYRHNSKHISASPSVASSPSPQPHDLVQRRRKGTPVRSPSQGDPSKGIVFAFRIKPDSDLSMAVDILSYDQVPEPDDSSSSSSSSAEFKASSAAANSSSTTTASTSKAITEVAAAPSIASTAVTAVGSVSGSSENGIQSSRESSSSSSQLKLAGEKWSSDPSSYLSNNIVDLSRNVLILHSRKPQEAASSLPSSAAALKVIVHVVAIDSASDRFKFLFLSLLVPLKLPRLPNATALASRRE